MRKIEAAVALFILLLSIPTGWVYAAGYDPGGNPNGGTSVTVTPLGAPALNETVGNYTGVFTLTYYNGALVSVQQAEASLRLCSNTCTMVLASLKEISAGTYAFTFHIPSLTGSVSIILPAGSLTDAYGRALPLVDTQIGSYVNPGGGAPASIQPAAAMEPFPGVLDQAVEPTQPNGSTTAEILLAVVFILGALGLAILPRRR